MISQVKRGRLHLNASDAVSVMEKVESPLPEIESGLSKGPSRTKKVAQDEALDLVSVSVSDSIHVTPEQDAQLLRKIDRNLMPIITCIYFLQLMDKQTLSFASVFGLSKDTGLVGDEYSLLGSIVSIAQLVMQPVSAFLLVKLRISVYVPTLVTCWGLTLLCMAAAHNFVGLLSARFVLGIFEASIQGAFILVVQIWYRRQEQGLRLAIWYSNAGWINIIGSLIMFGLGRVNSKVVYPYQLIFIVLGSITMLVGIASFFIFPDNAVKCKFLTKEEKIMAIERIRANQQGLEVKAFKIKQVIEMIFDPKSWCWMALMFTTSIPTSGINTFGPLILKGFGFKGNNVMLLMIPYGTLQLIFLFAGFWLNRKLSLKSPVIVLGLLMVISSSVILLRTGRSHEDQPVLLFAYYSLATFTASTGPTIVNWQSSNVAGHTKKSATIAFMATGGYAGAMVGPLFFSPNEKPYYHTGIMAMLISSCIALLLVGFTIAYLRYLNNANRHRRIRAGKAATMVDYSMLSSSEAAKERESQSKEAGGDSRFGANAFDDLTDLQNNEFIYVY